MKLRYVGQSPVTFTLNPPGQVFPGDEFEVADEQAEAVLAHALVERVPVKAGKSRSSKELPAAAEPASPVLTEPAAPAAAETA